MSGSRKLLSGDVPKLKLDRRDAGPIPDEFKTLLRKSETKESRRREAKGVDLTSTACQSSRFSSTPTVTKLKGAKKEVSTPSSAIAVPKLVGLANVDRSRRRQRLQEEDAKCATSAKSRKEKTSKSSSTKAASAKPVPPINDVTIIPCQTNKIKASSQNEQAIRNTVSQKYGPLIAARKQESGALTSTANNKYRDITFKIGLKGAKVNLTETTLSLAQNNLVYQSAHGFAQVVTNGKAPLTTIVCYRKTANDEFIFFPVAWARYNFSPHRSIADRPHPCPEPALDIEDDAIALIEQKVKTSKRKKPIYVPPRERPDVNFTETLYPLQEKCVTAMQNELLMNGSCVLEADTGSGKCFAADTAILMADGSVKKVQDIVIGDKLQSPPKSLLYDVDEDEDPTPTVLSITTGMDIMIHVSYVNLVTTEKHEITVTQDHPLLVQTSMSMSYKLRSAKEVLESMISTKYYMCIIDPREKYRDYKHHDCLITEVKYVPTPEPFWGFSISNKSKLFLAGNGLIVHNTVMTLALIDRMNKAVGFTLPTLIILPNNSMVEQWKNRIERFLKMEIGELSGSCTNYENQSIVVVSNPWLSGHYNDADNMLLRRNTRLVIVDECHLVGAAQLHKCLLVPTAYQVGLTATLDRKDGLMPSVQAFLGNTIKMPPKPLDPLVVVRTYHLHSNLRAYTAIPTRANAKLPDMTKMIGMISNCVERNEFIASLITDLLQTEPHRRILAIGAHKAQAHSVAQLLRQQKIHAIAIDGDTSLEDRDAANAATVLLGTASLLGTGFDDETRSVLVKMASDRDARQKIGRVMRIPAHLRKDNEHPIIIDLVDHYELRRLNGLTQVFVSQYNNRCQLYKSRGYTIKAQRKPVWIGNEVASDSDDVISD